MTVRGKTKRAPAPRTQPAVGPEATALFIALGVVLKQLRRTPLPRDPADRDTFQGVAAPRHIKAWLQIASDGPITLSALAEKMQVTLATMSQVVTELSEMGLIERTVDPTDRRRAHLTVTGAHRQLLGATIENRLEPVQRTLNKLSEAEGAALIRGLLILAEELGPGGGQA